MPPLCFLAIIFWPFRCLDIVWRIAIIGSEAVKESAVAVANDDPFKGCQLGLLGRIFASIYESSVPFMVRHTDVFLPRLYLQFVMLFMQVLLMPAFLKCMIRFLTI